MRTFIFTLLTTLFVSAMPLQAALAPANGDPDKVDQQTNKQTCLPISSVVDDDFRAKLASQHGGSILLTGADGRHLREVLAEHSGPAPWDFDTILIVKPTSDSAVTNLAYFDGGCLVGTGRFDSGTLEELIEQALGRTN